MIIIKNGSNQVHSTINNYLLNGHYIRNFTVARHLTRANFMGAVKARQLMRAIFFSKIFRNFGATCPIFYPRVVRIR